MTLKSHIEGKNAEVEIYADRIEWARAGDVSKSRVAMGALTFGASLVKTGTRKAGASEMIAVKAITSVTTAKDGLRYYKLVVIASGNTVEFRADKTDAEQAKTLLTQLIVGSHPSQQRDQASALPPEHTAPAMLNVPPPPAPAMPSAAGVTPSVGDQLRELGKLRDEGLITDEEFQAQKAKLLG